MKLRSSGGAEISPPRQLLCFHGRSAMEDSISAPIRTILRRHFPKGGGGVRSRASFTFKNGDEAQQQCRCAPQLPSPRPHTPFAASQSALHNAQPSPNTRTLAILLVVALHPPYRRVTTCSIAPRLRCVPVLHRALDAARATTHAGDGRVPWIVRAGVPFDIALPGAFRSEVNWIFLGRLESTP